MPTSRPEGTFVFGLANDRNGGTSGHHRLWVVVGYRTGRRDASSRANLLRDAERVIDLNARRHGF
jgi:hypothetical protein